MCADVAPSDRARPDDTMLGDDATVERPAPGERDLVARLLAGDEAAFESLVTDHHGSMLRVARIFLSKPDVAEEVVQETWLVVLRGLATFEGRSSLKTWIFRILANRARSRATREARVVPFAELASAEDEGEAEAALERRFRAAGRLAGALSRGTGAQARSHGAPGAGARAVAPGPADGGDPARRGRLGGRGGVRGPADQRGEPARPAAPRPYAPAPGA